MKKFCIKIAVLLFLVMGLALSYNYVYQSIRYRDNAAYTEEKFINVPDNIQIANLGSSHGVFGFDYSDYEGEYTTFNFALTSQTLSYDYRILQQYEDNLQENGVVFIVISNFSFGFNEESQPDFQSKNQRYYSFLEPQYIKQFNREQYIKTKFFGVLFEEPENVAVNIIKSNQKGHDSYQPGGADFDYEKDAVAAHERHLHLDDDGNLAIEKEEVDALYGIIELCKKHNIRPILVTTPFREEYNNLYDDEFYKQFHEIIDKVCAEENVEYYDYSHDSRFAHSYEYERNADHLTPMGAITFTDILIEEHIKK